MARPKKYDEGEQPYSLTIRIPHDLYEQAKQYVKMRYPLTLTALLIDALRLRLETPTDPRDLIVSNDNTVMHELQEMVDAAVQAAMKKVSSTAIPADTPIQPPPTATAADAPESPITTSRRTRTDTATVEAKQRIATLYPSWKIDEETQANEESRKPDVTLRAFADYLATKHNIRAGTGNTLNSGQLKRWLNKEGIDTGKDA